MNTLKNGLSGLIDIFIFIIFFYVFNDLNKLYFHLSNFLFQNINGLFSFTYLGLIPYYNHKRTLGELLLDQESRIKDKNLLVDKNSPKLFQILSIYFNRLFLILLDMLGINLIKGLWKLIRRKN